MIVFTQIRIVCNRQIRHPTPSGATCVPSLVLLTSPHCVGSCCQVLVTCGLAAACGTHVRLADPMAVSPTVFSRKWFVGRRRRSGSGWPGCLELRQSFRELLVGCRERGICCGERQVPRGELLENRGVVGCRKSEVVERCSQTVDGTGWCREDGVCSAERFVTSRCL